MWIENDLGYIVNLDQIDSIETGDDGKFYFLYFLDAENGNTTACFKFNSKKERDIKFKDIKISLATKRPYLPYYDIT